MSTYTGELDVEPDDFPLRAERIILREYEVAFDLRYMDEYGAGHEWTIDGTALLRPDGSFRCYVMDGTAGYDPGQSIIQILTANGDEEECSVKGIWFIRNEGRWSFSGILERYHP